jgi:hypothetical protein
LGTGQNQRIFPIILIAVGLLFLVGALVSLLLINQGDDRSNDAATNAEQDNPQIPRVDVAQAKSAYDTGLAVFVDVRDKVYFDSSHIPGAISIPLIEIGNRLDELDPNDWIILYCT